MQFHNGFSLQKEEHLFDDYISKNDFTIAGFSYGAIGALNATLKALRSSLRVDTLVLLSPAFFQTKEEKFKRLQLRAYSTNKEQYMQNFLRNAFAPHEHKALRHKESSYGELQELLEYVWNKEDLKFIFSRGVKIELYLGERDAIIDVEAAREFFPPYVELTYIKGANHFLQLG